MSYQILRSPEAGLTFIVDDKDVDALLDDYLENGAENVKDIATIIISDDGRVRDNLGDK